MATASSSRLRSRLTSRSAPRLVRTKTRVRPRSTSLQLHGQVVELGALGLDVDEAVLDVALLVLGRLLGVAAGVAGVGGGELAGRALQRGREEEGLAILRGLGDDPADRRFEAHVEHAVGLVEDEDADAVERDRRCGRAGPRAGRGWRRRCRRGGRRCSAGRSRRRRRRRRCAAGGRGRSSRARRRSGWPARGSGPGPGRRAPSPGSMRSTIGIPKASVLPEPVGDWTSRSWPASASLTTICWTGKGVGDAARCERAHHRFRDAEIGK